MKLLSKREIQWKCMEGVASMAWNGKQELIITDQLQLMKLDGDKEFEKCNKKFIERNI